MVRPFRRKSGKEQPPLLDDEDLVGVVDDDSIEPNSEIDLTRTKAEISEIEAISDENEIETKDDITKLLKNSSQTVVCTCLDIRRADNVLIVCDPTTGEIGQSLHEAAIERTDRVLLIVMPKGRHHGDEPPTPVANLMRQQSVIIAPTRYSLTHTKAIRQALKDGARVATMPGMNVEMFTKGGISADFTEIKRKISDLSPLFRRKRIVNVKSDNGTDVTFEVNWREWKMDDNGICNRPKMLTNLPAGKVFVLPRENSMNGTIVIDGSWESNLVDEPVTFTIEDGLVIDVKGGAIAASIRQEFGEAARRQNTKYRENVWTVAEFGFGMNPMARLLGNVLEDEKRLGTCYFAVGDNTSLGGSAAVGIHIPGVLKNASVWLDDTPIIENGKMLV
ncbi:MAG: aminopeptidase [Candidatus Poseidoniaceae archaeon]|nr:aminopeptidase [Candidatus Poseidoniaceae archaeon]